MNRILFILLLVLTSASFAEDRYGLNDYSYENNLKLNQIQNDLFMDQISRIQPPVVQQSYIEARGFHEIYRDTESAVFIQDNSISDLGNGNIFFSFLREFSKPQYLDNKTYFAGEGTATMKCKKSEIEIFRLIGMDRKYNAVVKFQRGAIQVETGWTKGIKNYLCR